MAVSAVLDAAGRRRSPATMPGYHAGRPPRNKGRLYPADPPTVEEIVAVMREASDDRHGYRLRALVVVLWRGGLRVAEALALGERDLDPGAGRCSNATARAAGAARSAWTPGVGSNYAPGSPRASSSPSGRCSA
jgi:integrase